MGGLGGGWGWRGGSRRGGGAADGAADPSHHDDVGDRHSGTSRTGNAPRRPTARALGRAGICAAVLASPLVAGAPAPRAGAATTGSGAAILGSHVALNQSWSVALPDGGGPVAESSPNVANLAGGPAVVVGDRAGNVYALHLADGSTVPGWPYHEGAPVDSTPSVDPGTNSVYIGSGNAANPTVGGYQAISAGGGDQWFVPGSNPGTDPYPRSGVQASLALGTLQGVSAVVAGNLGQDEYALNGANGAVLGGFPWFQGDSNFTTPAIADLYGNGQNEIVQGGDSTAGTAYGVNYPNGGHIRVLGASGNAGSGSPGGGLVCDNLFSQTIQSSPAVGEFLGGSTVGIVFGTGNTYGSPNTDQVIATDAHCNDRWATTLDGSTATSSPALADVLGNGQLQVVEGTAAGTVYVLNGTNGSVAWSANTSGAVLGSVVTADLTGQGYQDLIVPTTNGVQIFDGRSGQLVTTVLQNQGFQNAPLVTHDASGTIGITVAGYFQNVGGQLQGEVTHFSVPGSNGALATESGAWPMFHHDPQLTGNAGTPPPVVVVPCNAPAGGPHGYVMAASDGGVFDYGNLPFCGSLGNLQLNAPVVSIAETGDGGGYWMVASDGGLFAFDDAGYYGSMGGRPLNQPIVGMAATPDGKGYWLVARDGGMFAFGDAGYYGSMGGRPLNAPIVGMAATADGKGYWLVASDGGLFAFGDAAFHGSMGGRHLNFPVAGIAADTATGGYWEVALDGGVFAFDAPFYGSMGGRHLNAYIVGMAATADGSGYRFVASDGGIFAYNASFAGSMGGEPLNRPIVGMAGS